MGLQCVKVGLNRRQGGAQIACRWGWGDDFCTVPIGYVIDADRHFQIDPLKAPFVVEAFKRYAEGATMKDIMDWLNKQGVKTGRNRSFTYGSVQTLLTNRRYIGENRFQDIVVPDTIPVIIEKELFERVQEKMAKNCRSSC